MRTIIYRAYNFIDKDPVIDELRTIIQKEHMTPRDVERAGGPRAATLRNWFGGPTRRPQHPTIMAAARAMGYDYRLVKIGRGGIHYKKGEKH